MDCSEKNDIMGRCFIIGTAADDRGGECVFSLLYVTQRRLPEAFCRTQGTVCFEYSMAPGQVPVSGFRPLLGFVMAPSVLPDQLNVSTQIRAITRLQQRAYRQTRGGRDTWKGYIRIVDHCTPQCSY